MLRWDNAGDRGAPSRVTGANIRNDFKEWYLDLGQLWTASGLLVVEIELSTSGLGYEFNGFADFHDLIMFVMLVI